MSWKSKEYWIIFILLLITGIYINILRYSQNHAPELINLTDISTTTGEWQVNKNFSLDDKTQYILKTDQYIWRKYANSRGTNISLFVSYYKNQKYGEQIHSPKHCLPGSGWKIINKEIFTIPIHNSPVYKLKINKLVNSNGQHSELVLYWFWTRNGTITSEYNLKFDLAKNSLLRKPTDAAFIRINLAVKKTSPEAMLTASQFITEIFPSINKILPFHH